MSPLEIVPVLASQLHHVWSFMEPGLREIQAVCKAEWIPEDHYSQIYNGRMEAFIFKRDNRWLGFYNAYPAPIVFGRPELKYFIHAIWSERPRNRLPEDLETMTADRRQTIEFIKHRARELKCVCIEAVSPRNFLKCGFEEHAVVYRMTI